MTDRTQILQRTLNLRELAQSSGSEAEAMAAMKIADKLMKSYRIEEAELALAEGLGEITVEIADETCDTGFLKVGSNRHKVCAVIWDIQTYCDVKVTTRSSAGTYRAIGDKPDVEMFHYLVAMIKSALDSEYAIWKRSMPAVGRGAKGSFQIAMGERIAQRLREMKAEQNAERKDAEREAAKALNCEPDDIRMAVNNGNLHILNSHQSLVVASVAAQKRKAVDAAYTLAYKNVRLGTASSFGYGNNGSAAGAGRAAGNRLGLHKPVGGAAARGLLN